MSYHKAKKSIGQLLHSKRNEKGYSLYKLSQLSNVRADTISGIEKGQGYNIDNLLKVCQALNVNNLTFNGLLDS